MDLQFSLSIRYPLNWYKWSPGLLWIVSVVHQPLGCSAAIEAVDIQYLATELWVTHEVSRSQALGYKSQDFASREYTGQISVVY